MAVDARYVQERADRDRALGLGGNFCKPAEPWCLAVVAEDLNLPSAAYRPVALELGILRNAATSIAISGLSRGIQKK